MSADEQLIALQEMLAHQQAAIEQMSNEMFAQQQEIAELKQQVKQLSEQVAQSSAQEAGDEPPPPHY